MVRRSEVITPEFREKVESLYKGGKSIREITIATGRSFGTIHRTLTTSETVTLRPRGGIRAETRRQGNAPRSSDAA